MTKCLLPIPFSQVQRLHRSVARLLSPSISADTTKNSFYQSNKVPGINRMNTAFSLTQWIPPNQPNSHNDQVSQSMAVVDVWLALLLILPPPPALSFQVHPFDKVKTATKTQTKTSPKLRHAQPNLTF